MATQSSAHGLAHTTAPTPLTSFTLFKHLPKELRFMIWEMAIERKYPVHPLVADAHFFSMVQARGWEYNLETAPYCPFHDRQVVGANAVCHRQSTVDNHTIELGQSHYRPMGWDTRLGLDEAREYRQADPSAYLLDQSLLSACEESRRIITRFRRVGSTSLARRSPGQPWDRSKPCVVYFRTDEWLREAILWPAADLFCVKNQDVAVMFCNACETRPEHGRDLVTDWIFDGKQGPRNFAVEIGKPWMDGFLNQLSNEHADEVLPTGEVILEENSHPSFRFVMLLARRSCVETLWFIDDRLRPMPQTDIAALEETRVIFYANGFKLIPVNEDEFPEILDSGKDDPESGLWWRQDNSEPDGRARYSVFQGIDIMQDIIDRRIEDTKMKGGKIYDGLEYPGLKVGLLAKVADD